MAAADTDITLLTIDLLDRFDHLQQCRRQFLDALKHDAELPFIFPEHPDLTGPEARDKAGESLTRFWRGPSLDKPIESGLMCISSATADTVTALNVAKQQFKSAVIDLRTLAGRRKESRVDLLINQLCGEHPEREATLKTALKRANLAGLDTEKCYCLVRVIGPEVVSFSVTWARRHSNIEATTREEVMAKTEALPDTVFKERIVDKLSRLPAATPLASVTLKRPQMRANVIQTTPPNRKPLTLSGVTLVDAPRLPEFIWRDRPEQGDPQAPRVKRSDSTIEAEPFIKELNIHRYKEASLA